MLSRVNAALIAVLMGAAMIPTSARANLLVNGSFEMGDLTGFTQSGNTDNQTVSAGFYGPEDGTYGFVFGPSGSDGVLSQTFADTPGGTLTATGYLTGNGSGISNLGSSIDGVLGFTVSPVPDQPYTLFTFTAPATGSDTFSINYRNDPFFDEVDNLSVVETGPGPVLVSEPKSALILGAALLGLVATVRRKRT